MRKKFLQIRILVLSVCVFMISNVYSQTRTEFNLFSLSDNNSVLNSPELKKAVSNALLFQINKNELQSLYEKKLPQIILNMPVSVNNSVKLFLNRFDVLAPNAKIVARTAHGNEELSLTDLAVSYTGKVEGQENAFVTITFTKDNVTGMVGLADDNIILGSLKDNSGNQTDNYILYKERDLKIKNSLHCETEENLSSADVEKMRNVIMSKMNESSSTDLYIAEIAIELDYATYNVYGGSVLNTTNYAIALMSGVSAMYMKEVNVKLIIPYLRVWTTPDPYNGATSNDLLNQFRNEWNANQQSVQRTLAHFISKRADNLGGIAWLTSLCASTSSGFGYGFSNTLGGTIQLPTFSYEIQVVAHELGHNFGSLHTFNCNWVGGPIDTCFTVEGGCYSGPLHAATGTIMSYCYNNGSVSFILGFGPQPRAVIRNGAESAGCMYVSQRAVQVGFPNGGETYRTGNTTPVWWGTSLTGNVNIELSTNNGSSWFTVQNNIPAAQRTYNWTVPPLPTSLQSKLRILDSSNPNVGDTSDASFKIILNLNVFVLLSPPTLTRLEVSSTNTGTQKFTWQSGGTEPSINYKFKLRKIGTTLDYNFTSDNNGHDTSATVRKSLLDSIAQAMGTTGDSVRCTWRAWGYNGFDSSSSNNNFIITLVRTSVGINIISSIVPDKFGLENNYPNPFNPVTIIKFDIAKSTFTELKIFDSRGSEIKSLVSEVLLPGQYEYTFNAGNLPSGAYFYRLKSSEFSQTKRMVLLK